MRASIEEGYVKGLGMNIVCYIVLQWIRVGKSCLNSESGIQHL
jgi:hypothetical protein